MLYILNTLIVPIDFDRFSQRDVTFRRITVEEARWILQRNPDFISAVGHQGTAQVLSRILGVEIPAERRTIFMEPGDRAIHFFLKQRLPEGRVLTAEELEKLDYWLVLSEVW